MLKLGVIGLSEGNGHPYSWAAICNGFNKEAMQNCPFPLIPEYLSSKKYPDDFLSDRCEVTHVWTQDSEVSKSIAKASKIPYVMEHLSEMASHVDAVLLARDDADNHAGFADHFLNAGLPIYIDKPLAVNIADATNLLNRQRYDTQIFSCSALRYAEELVPDSTEVARMGQLQFIQATVPKSWKKYAVHIIEPIVARFTERGELLQSHRTQRGEVVHLSVEWMNLSATFTTYGKHQIPLEIRYFFENGMITKTLTDTFSAFKAALTAFINQATERKLLIPREDTLEIVQLIERGCIA